MIAHPKKRGVRVLSEYISSIFSFYTATVGTLGTIAIWIIDFFYTRNSTKPKHGATWLPWYLYALVLCACLILSSYWAWLGQADQLKEADSKANALVQKLEDKKPKFVSGYYEAYCLRTFPLLAVLTYINNAGGSASAAHSFKLVLANSSNVPPMVNTGGGILHIRLAPPDAPTNSTDMIFLMKEFLQQRVLKTSVTPGSSMRGWLLWAGDGENGIRGDDCSQFQGARIFFKDILDHPYEIVLDKIQVVPPIPSDFQGYPDITHPFQQRRHIKNFEEQEKRESAK